MRIAKIKTTRFYRKVVIGFSLATLVLFGIIIYFSFSKTVISITLEPQDKSTTMTINVKPAPSDGSATEPQAIIGLIVETAVDGSREFTNPSEGDSVDAQATGTVTIYNNWPQEQPLAATTRLLSPDGVLFRLKERTDVPAGGSVENIEVYADAPGAGGNIKPTKFTIPGLWPGLQDKIYAESSQTMTGGVRSARVITASVLNDARTTLREQLVDQSKPGLSDTEALVQTDYTIPDEAITWAITEETSSVEENAEAEKFTLDMSLTVTAVALDENAVLQTLLARLKSELSADETVDTYSTDGLSYRIEDISMQDQTATLIVTLTAAAIPRLSSPVFSRDQLTGKDEQEIKSYFSNFDEIKSVSVKFSPFWVRHAPGLKDHIEVRLAD